MHQLELLQWNPFLPTKVHGSPGDETHNRQLMVRINCQCACEEGFQEIYGTVCLSTLGIQILFYILNRI